MKRDRRAGRAGEVPAAAEATVREIYRELDERPVERACVRRGDCCSFKRTGREPYVTKGEVLLVAKAYRASGRRRIAEAPDGSCPLLDASGKCSVYAARPFGCRTHFCAAAGGPVARGDVVDLIHRLADLDARLGGSGVRRLSAALADALV